LDAAHRAREVVLRSCRATIQACGQSIRATHRGSLETAQSLAASARASLGEAQAAVAPFPRLIASGVLHDAEKEYAEAMLCFALVSGAAPAGFEEIGVSAAAWLNGLAEAASELRRCTLDALRAGDVDRAEGFLTTMDEAYGVLITVDLPDAITGNLRRTTDALRAVLERTRSDVTTTVLQARLGSQIREAFDRLT
jgi:translin